MAKDFLKRARARLIDAEAALKRGDYPETVRYSQECVELSLKACLRTVGIEYPKVHDVGGILRFYTHKFPEWMQDQIESLAEASRDLAEKRAPSMYGLEALGKTASDLFGFDEAKDALEKAKKTYKVASKFINEFYES